MKKFYRYSLIFCLFIVTLLLDRVFKRWVTSSGFSDKEVMGKFFQITFIKNPDAAFGISLGSEWVYFVLAFVAFFLMALYLIREKKGDTRLQIIGIVLSGVGILGNIIDRVQYGYVVDYIQVWKFPVINIADASLFVGACFIGVFEYTLHQKSRVHKDHMV